MPESKSGALPLGYIPSSKWKPAGRRVLSPTLSLATPKTGIFAVQLLLRTSRSLPSAIQRGGSGKTARLCPPVFLGWVRGLEPPTPGTTIQCSNQLSYTHHFTSSRIISCQKTFGNTQNAISQFSRFSSIHHATPSDAFDPITALAAAFTSKTAFSGA